MGKKSVDRGGNSLQTPIIKLSISEEIDMYVCDTCKIAEPVCDDYCLDCEIKFFVANPNEQPDLFEQVDRDPVRFADWIPVVAALRNSTGSRNC